MDSYIPGKTLGIIGGGQLGRMLLPEARRLGLKTAVFTASEQDPAVGGTDLYIQGRLDDGHAIARFAESCDYLTIEIEHVALEGLEAAEKSGCIVFPPSKALAIVQDKLAQRRCFEGLPQPEYAELPPYANGPKWRQEVLEIAGRFGFPVVQKSRRGGYDGRGVAVLRNEDDILLEDGRLLCDESYLEAFVPLSMEPGVIVARTATGECTAFPVTEMLFDPDDNICTSVAFPARIDPLLAEQAVEIAKEAARRLDTCGLLAVELFLGKDGKLYLNEVAPRPHNSGHGTIEGLPTSQFAQHLRAGMGLPLGAMDPVIPTVMNNLLGSPQAKGKPCIRGLDEMLRIPGTQLHWYGKPEVRPGRKMGHVSVTAASLDLALSNAAAAAKLLVVDSCRPDQTDS
ncbi:5-(carboxyamino)imidazole ribonucleotide synthase [Spirochaeta dissipatitropha]